MNSVQLMIALSLLAVCSPCESSGMQTAEQRKPSGDLSDFFNPPGVSSKTGLGSSGDSSATTTTRKIGSADARRKGDSKTDPKTDSNVDPKPSQPSTDAEKMDAASAAKLNPRSKSKSQSRNLPSPDDDNFQVKIENDESLGELEGGVTFGDPAVINWRVGVLLATGSTPVSNVMCRIPVPTQWPEQTVSVDKEELPTEITDVSWDEVDNLKFLTFRINDVTAGEKLIGLVTFRVSTQQIIAPTNTSIFRVPESRIREIKKYLTASPEIEFRDARMKKQAKSLFENNQSDWNKVQAVFDWVRDNIEERAGEPVGATKTFRDKSGSGEDRVGLFVAMCRINKVPARMVFVDGSQYAEFYLVDDKQVGHWFPCNVSGIREFGEIGEPKVILQKGDNFKVPGEKKKLKFVPAIGISQGTKPRVLRFVREPMSVN